MSRTPLQAAGHPVFEVRGFLVQDVHEPQHAELLRLIGTLGRRGRSGRLAAVTGDDYRGRSEQESRRTSRVRDAVIQTPFLVIVASWQSELRQSSELRPRDFAKWLPLAATHA
jgi:hypothetical protein